MNDMNFTMPEVLSLVALVHAIYILVHLSLRRLPLQSTGLPLFYFFVLSCAFFLDFGQRNLQEFFIGYQDLQWWAWFLGPPLSVLLIIQISKANQPLKLSEYVLLLILPLCWGLSVVVADAQNSCTTVLFRCKEYQNILYLNGFIAGTLSLLTIFTKTDLLSKIKSQKYGSERYWLCFSLIIMNIGFLISVIMYMSQNITQDEMLMMRAVLGLGFVYLISTNLLRLYPKSKKTSSNTLDGLESLSSDEKALIRKIEDLLTMDKIYQEASYSRKDLARECDSSEIVISKIINIYFQKSFPQLMNEYRIEEAKNLLVDTQEPINVIAEEVGFNSLPTFNRVFKEMEGVSPSAFRNKSRP